MKRWRKCPDCGRRFRKLSAVWFSDLGYAKWHRCPCGSAVVVQRGKIVESMRPVSERKARELMRALKREIAR